jgi:hypothetical protein
VNVVSQTKAARTGDDRTAERTIRSLDDVPGWFKHTDQILFDWLLTNQESGDLLELGVYLGKTAIYIGNYLRPGERFTVCDLFDLARSEDSILPDVRSFYSELTQDAFERNYLTFHDTLPTIVRAKTSEILDHVAPASCRFIHIDASHMYEHVRGDLMAARKLLTPTGIVVLDDYRTEHTPGTAAAIWQAVANHGLRVICVSPQRFYATWANPTDMQDALVRWIDGRDDHYCDMQDVLGQRLVRVAPKRGNPRSSMIPQPKRPAWKRLALAVLPPVVTQPIQRHRRR